jgi:hypothetical protein
MGVWQGKGEQAANAKLTEAAVREIRKLRAEMPYTSRKIPKKHPLTIKNLSRKYGVCYNQMQRIVSGEVWRHVQ